MYVVSFTVPALFNFLQIVIHRVLVVSSFVNGAFGSLRSAKVAVYSVPRRARTAPRCPEAKRRRCRSFSCTTSTSLLASGRRSAKAFCIRQRRQRASVGKSSAKCCSFSAVSAPIFARKYAFCSIFQNLPDSQAAILQIL